MMKQTSKNLLLGAICMVAAACSQNTPAPTDPSDIIFHGGTVLPLTSADAAFEAIAVKDGRIQAIGKSSAVLKFADDGTVLRDLEGQTLMPGFIHAHAHFSFLATKNAVVDLDPPPDGGVGSIEALISAMQARLPQGEAAGALIGMGYDDTVMSEGRHPTRHDLDRISETIPVFALHISGHLASVNSAGLSKLGIDEKSEDPPGGHLRREADGVTPNGVLEEGALALVAPLFPSPTQDIQNMLFSATAQQLVSLGITTATDHATNPVQEGQMQAFADTGELPIDLIAYRRIGIEADLTPALSSTYKNGFRVGGAKIVLDGSLQGWTGYLTKPYTVQREGQEADYRGYANLQSDALNGMVKKAYAENWPLLVHTNGDAATDMYLAAVKAAKEAHPDTDLRPVIIHAQTMREDQIFEAAELGMIASFFVDHVYFWGDRHRDIFLGEERADRISPTGSALSEGLMFTLHDDAPIVKPSPLRSVWAAVNRTTSSGAVLGKDQAISPYEALRAVTYNAAYQHFEEAEKGTLEVGKRADFVVLDSNPLTAPPSSIRDIQVLETIKDGRSVFSATQ